MTPSSPGLAAVRFPLDPGPPIDPFALAGSTGILFHAEGRVLVGLGTALTIALPHGLDADGDVRRATAALASLPCDDPSTPSSSGVVAFASLPFERSAPASLVRPRGHLRLGAGRARVDHRGGRPGGTAFPSSLSA